MNKGADDIGTVHNTGYIEDKLGKPCQNTLHKFVSYDTFRPVGGSLGLVWPPGWLAALHWPLTL